MLAVSDRLEPLDEFVTKTGWLEDGRVIEQAEHPRADGRERRHAEHEVDRPVVCARHHLVLADLVDDPSGFQRVDADAHLHRVSGLRLPRLVGQRGLHVDHDAVGHRGAARLTPRHLTVDAIHPERAHARALDVPRHQIPVPEAEPQADGRNDAGRAAAVRERRRRMCAHRFEELDERCRRHQRRDGTDVAEAGCAKLQQRIAATRIAEVDAGDGEVQRDLLVGFEVEVGQIERVTIDPVPELLDPRQPLREHGDALVAQQALVPLEGLAARRVLRRVARDLVRDGVERQGLRGVQQDEDEIGDALEPIELRGGLHRPEPTAAGAP